MLSQTIGKNHIFDTSLDTDAKKPIGLQAHGGIVVNQGRFPQLLGQSIRLYSLKIC